VNNIPSLSNTQDENLSIDAVDDPERAVDWVLQTLRSRTLILLDPLNRRGPRGFYLSDDSRTLGVDWLHRNNRAGVEMNAYFQLNPTPPGFAKKASDDDITALEIVGQADIDAKGGRSMMDCRAAITALPLRPTFQIMTGGGFQIGYRLSEPLPRTPENTAWAVALSRRISELVAGDAVHDISRIFRLPYSMNWPSERKRRDGRVQTPAGLVIR
jgi:hypothetical protein